MVQDGARYEATEAATGTLNGKTLKGEVFGDQGPTYMMRILTQPNSLSNVLFIRENLSHAPMASSGMASSALCGPAAAMVSVHTPFFEFSAHPARLALWH